MRPSVTWLNSRSSLAACDWLTSALSVVLSDVAENWGSFLYRVYRPEEWLWIDSNGKMETRHPVEGSFGNEFPSIYNHCGVSVTWSRKKLKKNFFLHFWKTTPCGKIFKILFREDSSRHRSACCVQISWNLAERNRWNGALLTWQTKKQTFRLALQLSLLRGSRPKSARASPRQCTQSAPESRFHPNRFTFGVNTDTVRARSKLNPIFGWSLASSWIIIRFCYVTILR